MARIEILTIRDAAAITGMSAETIEAGLIQGRFPWGYAIQTSENRWRYWINAKKFREVEMIPEEDTA